MGTAVFFSLSLASRWCERVEFYAVSLYQLFIFKKKFLARNIDISLGLSNKSIHSRGG